MKFSQSFIHFNKEILSGEVGAIVGAQLAGFIIRHFELNETIMSSLVVVGAIVGSALFYLPMRIYHQKKRDNFSVSRFSKDLILYSLAAILLTVLFYYPTLFFLDKYLLKVISDVNLAVFVSQTIAFLVFLILINIYRFFLKIFFHKEI
jgi:uncharacterized membrane protein YeaQ/YmgE (transglycosylase-associated protein family)/uncharacterized protein with PQ loop repeat